MKLYPFQSVVPPNMLLCADIEANVRMLLSDTQGATPRPKPRSSVIEDKAATTLESFQSEGVSFAARGFAQDEASIGPGPVRKEAAWKAVEDLPHIPRMFYQLAGESEVHCDPYYSRH